MPHIVGGRCDSENSALLDFLGFPTSVLLLVSDYVAFHRLSEILTGLLGGDNKAYLFLISFSFY
jgi:hypothetical protein